MDNKSWIDNLRLINDELYHRLHVDGVQTIIEAHDSFFYIFHSELDLKSDLDVYGSSTIYLNVEVLKMGFTLVIDNAFIHPLCNQLRSKIGYRMGAFLGVPLLASDGRKLGSLGVYDKEPLHWSAQQIAQVNEFKVKIIEAIGSTTVPPMR